MKRDTNYYRSKGSYSRPGKEAKKQAKFYETEPLAQIGTDEIVNRYTSMTPGEDASWRSVKEAIDGETTDEKPTPKKKKGEIDGETGKSAARDYSNLGTNTTADRKPVMVNVNGKKTVRMEPVKRDIVKESTKMKLRSQNDVRAMLFDFCSDYINKESMPNLMKLAKVIGKKLTKTGASFMIESVLDEKTLTKAELNKREEIAKAIERDNPNMPMDKKMAIATAAAKRVAEMNFHEFRNQLVEAKATMCGRCGTKHVKPSEGGTCPAVKEEVEQLDELSPATHKSYQAKAFTDGARAMAAKRMGTMSTRDAYEKEKRRHRGIDTSKHLNRTHHGVKEGVEQVDENKVKLKGFGPDHAKGNMGNPAARAALGKRMADNEKAREALKDPKHNPSWANSKSRMESVELDENVKKAYEIMKPTKSMDHGIEAIKKGMKVDHNTATEMAKKVMDKVKKGEFKEGTEERLKMIRAAGEKINKEKKKAERDAKRAMSKDKDMMGENNSAPQTAAHRRAMMVGVNRDKRMRDNETDKPPFTPDPPKSAPKNSDGSKTTGPSRAKQLAKMAMKKKTMGEAKSFDQKFKDHLKYATSDSPAVKSYMAKKQDQRNARNAKMDPGAAKKGLAISVIDRQKAYAKGKKKGIGVMNIDTRPGKDHATGKSTYRQKLPK